jgi:hypothetical protein
MLVFGYFFFLFSAFSFPTPPPHPFPSPLSPLPLFLPHSAPSPFSFPTQAPCPDSKKSSFASWQGSYIYIWQYFFGLTFWKYRHIYFPLHIPLTRFEHLVCPSVWHASDCFKGTLNQQGCKNKITHRTKERKTRRRHTTCCTKKLRYFSRPQCLEVWSIKQSFISSSEIWEKEWISLSYIFHGIGPAESRHVPSCRITKSRNWMVSETLFVRYLFEICTRKGVLPLRWVAVTTVRTS